VKKRIAISVDDDVFEGIKDLPRRVSVSESMSLVLRMLVEAYKPNGMAPEEFRRKMLSDDRYREAFLYIADKLQPVFRKEDEIKAAVKKVLHKKK
jgi:hypothetical protein